MVRRVDRRSAQQRHDDGFHDELEERAEQEADRDAPQPAPGAHEPDGRPRRLGRLHPREHQERAQWREEEVARENDEDREDPDRAEAPQLPRYFGRR